MLFLHFVMPVLPYGQDSMILQQNNPLLLIVTIILMVCGGLGFITWTEVIEYLKNHVTKKKKFLSLYSKIVLYTTAALTISSTLMFWVFVERQHCLC